MHASIRKTSRWLLLLAALALVASACAPGEEPEVPDVTEPEEPDVEEPVVEEPVEGGTIVFGADQEPAILNPNLTEGNLFATSIVTTPILPGLWNVTPDFEYVPWVLDGEPEITEDPFTVTYTLKSEAAWSDGTPMTAEDVEFTWETIMNEEFDITSRNGYDKIVESEILDEKSIRFTFDEPFAPWRTLFALTGGILPKHALEDEDYNTVWNDELVNPKTGEPISGGPFIFESWQRGQQVTIVRNDNYWGQMASLDTIVYRFIEDSTTQVQQLRGGEIDMFYPQPQLDLVDQVAAIDGIEFEATAGTIWEHLDFNLAVPPLDQQYVRQAIARSIDREAVVESFIVPINPDAEPLNNVVYMNNQADYVDNWGATAGYDPDAAVALLEENGCTRDADEIWVCEGERLEFDYVTTAGNQRRELAFELIQAQLADVGIVVNAAFGPAADVFGTVLPAGPEGAWAMFNFAWVGSPDPFGGNTIYICDGDLNYNSYCNDEVTELISATDRELDPGERANLYNQADALMAEDVDKLPLYQFPTFFGWSSRIQGPRDNPTQAGPFWNVEEWRLVG